MNAPLPPGPPALPNYQILMAGYAPQDSKMYSPTMKDWVPEMDLLTRAKQVELNYEPQGPNAMTRAQWDIYDFKKAQVADKTVEYRGNAFAGVANFLGNAARYDYVPTFDEVQGKFDHHMTDDAVEARALRGVNSWTETRALEITKEIYPILFVNDRDRYELVLICVEWDGVMIDGGKIFQSSNTISYGVTSHCASLVLFSVR